MGITDRQAEAGLREIRERIKSFEDMQLPENKRWAANRLQGLPAVILKGAQATTDPDSSYTPEPAFRSLYAVRNFGLRDGTRESLRGHMQLLTSVRTTGDGNCHDRSTMISLTGGEDGHLGLRLRNTLYFIANNDKMTGGGHARDFHVMSELAQPGQYLGDEATALTALTLQCPVAVVAPLGVQGARHLCRLFVPPTTAPGAHVILKAWTGITVRHPPIEEIPNDSGQALYHYCTALAPSTAHIERILSHLTCHPLLKEQAVGRNRAVFDPTEVPRDQIDVDNPVHEMGQPGRHVPSYAEAVKGGSPYGTCEPAPNTMTKTVNGRTTEKRDKPDPRGQQRLDNWVMKTKPGPRPTVPSKPTRHSSKNDSRPSHNETKSTQKGNRYEPLRELRAGVDIGESWDQARRDEPDAEADPPKGKDGEAPWPIFEKPRVTTTARPRETKRRKRTPPEGADRPWVFYLENTRGLTADNTVAEMAGIIDANKPDVVMFTETQLRTMAKGRGAKIHKQILGGNYVVYQSPASDTTRGQGVMVAVHR